MTKKKTDKLAAIRYRRNEQIVNVIEGATVLLHDGEMPDGVTRGGNQELLFQGVPITDSSMLVYDELGTPLDLWSYDVFKATYASEFDGVDSNSDLKVKLDDAKKVIADNATIVLDLNSTVDGLRHDRAHLKNLIERLAAGLGVTIDDYDSEEAFVEAATAKKASDHATNVLRDILRIEPAQVRDDGGRIIHLNKKIIDRVVAIV